MTGTDEQVEREDFELGEKPYQKIPKGAGTLNDYFLKKGDYQVEVYSFCERLRPEDNGGRSYHAKAGICIKKSRQEEGYTPKWFYELKDGFGGGRRYSGFDMDDTEATAKLFSKRVHESLRDFKNIWIDLEKTEQFVYEALEPVRERRRKLAEIVEGVGFGELNEQEGGTE